MKKISALFLMLCMVVCAVATPSASLLKSSSYQLNPKYTSVFDNLELVTGLKKAPAATQGLQYDATEADGAIDVTYTSADQVQLTTDYVAEYGELYLRVVSADNSHMLSLAMFVDATDPTIVIPAGTYPVASTGANGTVYASPGVQNGSVYPSFWGRLSSNGGITTPLYFIEGGNVVVENVDGKLKVTVDAVNSNNVAIKVVVDLSAGTEGPAGMQYDEQSGSVDRTYTSEDILQVDLQYASSGQIYVDVVAADMSDQMSLLFFSQSVDPEIGLPAGTYPISATPAYGTAYASKGYVAGEGVWPCFYSTLVEQQGQLYLDKLYYMIAGQIVVEKVDGKMRMTIDAVNSYNVPIHVVYDATSGAGATTGLPYDEKEGAVDVAYTTADNIYYTLDFIPDFGELYIDLFAADNSHATTLTFMVEAADAETKVPVGVYSLSDTYAIGTAMAGLWVEDPTYGGYPMGCYYATLSGDYIEKLWYMVEGTVTVTKNDDASITIVAEATNSYGVPVKVTYNATAADETALENIKVVKNARKMVKNNQIIVVKDGVEYNVLGSVVE